MPERVSKDIEDTHFTRDTSTVISDLLILFIREQFLFEGPPENDKTVSSPSQSGLPLSCLRTVSGIFIT